MPDWRDRFAGTVTFTFGDSQALSDQLLALVRSGAKRVTFVSVAEIEMGRDVMPKVGRRDIALNWDGTPALLCETLELIHVRFCDVSEEMALSEGEDDTLASWQRGHQAYFERLGIFHPETMLICERFDVIEDFAQD